MVEIGLLTSGYERSSDTKGMTHKSDNSSSAFKPSEKRRKTSKNSQIYTNSFLFLIMIELYGDPFLWLVKLAQITQKQTKLY